MYSLQAVALYAVAISLQPEALDVADLKEAVSASLRDRAPPPVPPCYGEEGRVGVLQKVTPAASGSLSPVVLGRHPVSGRLAWLLGTSWLFSQRSCYGSFMGAGMYLGLWRGILQPGKRRAVGRSGEVSLHHSLHALPHAVPANRN